MAINPALPASSSLVAALNSQPQAEAGPAVHAEAAAPTPAPVPAPEALRPRANASAEARASQAASAYERAEGPSQARATPRIDANEEANKLVDKYVEAEKAGVSLAKATFIKKLGEVAIKTAIVGIAVGATVASGGLLALVAVPVIVLTAIDMAISSGDAACCHHNWQAAKSQAEGGDKQRLIGGDSIITHALMKAARGVRSGLMGLGVSENSRLLASEANTDKIAKGVSIGFKIGLAAATSWFTAGLTGAGSAAGATTAIQAGAHLAKVGFLVTSITGAATQLLTVVQRGFRERQFLGQAKRDNRLQDLYQASIPRTARGLQRMNSIANDSTRLMIAKPDAFRNAIRADVPGTTSRARANTAILLSETFGDDAASLRRAGQGAARGGSNVNVDEAKAQAFASVAKGTAEDVGNAFVNAGKFGLTGAAITADHFGWIKDVKNLVGL